jgi:hypothetical protein
VLLAVGTAEGAALPWLEWALAEVAVKEAA